MGFARIKGELRSRIGCAVRFSAPKDVQIAGGAHGDGVIEEEVWVDHALNASSARQASSCEDWGDYSFCAQLIRWSDGSKSIRLAYYRRRAGEDWWEYASQMTVNSEPATIKALLEKTLAMTTWFS